MKPRNPILITAILVVATVLLVVASINKAVSEDFAKHKKFLDMVDAAVVINDRSGWRGSGVFIKDNVVLTAAHCLKNEGIFTVELRDGTLLESENFYVDEKEDIGFIYVDANKLSIAEVSLSPVEIGDIVYLVGTPFQKICAFTLTKGIISHLNRDLPEMNWENLLQTDAEGGPGSSGGPLYNSDGNLIGMYVGHFGPGGVGVSLCEDATSILEAYERYTDATNLKRN